MKNNHLQVSPCVGCKRVAEPENCDNKMCADWRRWYEKRWDFLCGCAWAAKGRPEDLSLRSQ